MKFKSNFFLRYLQLTPLPLAIERSWECEILSRQNFEKPILDIGCGDGIFASVLFDEKIDTGIDILAREINAAFKTNQYRELIHGSADKIDKPDNYYATIFSNSACEHIPEIIPVFREIARVLRPDGRLYLTLPTNYFEEYTLVSRLLCFCCLKSLSKKYHKIYNAFWNQHHSYLRENWCKLFEQNSFTVVNIIEYGPKRNCTINDILTLFTVPNFLVKKLLNRFFLFTYIRKWYSPLLYNLFKGIVKIDRKINNGGLIFFELKKKV